jgi:hypothetical protein
MYKKGLKFDMEKSNLNKSSEIEWKEMYRVEVSSMFAALVNLGTEADINSVWETIRENIKIYLQDKLCYQLKKHKPWFDEGY